MKPRFLWVLVALLATTCVAQGAAAAETPEDSRFDESRIRVAVPEDADGRRGRIERDADAVKIVFPRRGRTPEPDA